VLAAVLKSCSWQPGVRLDRAGAVRLRPRQSGPPSYASTGNGGTPHLTAERLKTIAGVRIVHVPYKGIPAAIPDLVAGRVDIMFANVSGVLPHVREGKLKVIAVASAERIASFPEVPTMEETLPGFVSDTWFALLRPGTPAAIVASWHRRSAILRSPEVVAKYRDLGATPVEFPAGTGALERKRALGRSHPRGWNQPD
jgi:tripartite-type tricarboxylate transporter receptor subunit TctC